MNSKIKNYVETLFSDIPRSKKANELKEELLSNMSERFDDYIKQGKTENQAYSLVISNLGDIDEMLSEVIPNDEFVTKANSYRRRNAKNTAISVAMYMIGVACFLGFNELGAFSAKSYFYESAGLVLLLLIAAVATGILIYSHMSTPPEFKDYDEQSRHERFLYTGKNGRILKSLLSIYWTFVLIIYLAISFLTCYWRITWIIWIIAAVFEEVIKTVYELRYGDE